jgi:DNA invertase Pin-like site-specific DNA recombinase
MKLKQPGKIWSYDRWSSRQQTNGDSQRRQNDFADAWCQRQGLELHDRLVDPATSARFGGNRKKGKLGELLGLAQEGDTILIEDHSRWSREAALDSMVAIRDVVNRDVRLIFLRSGMEVNRNNFNTLETFMGNTFYALMAHAENEERTNKIRKAMEGKRLALAQGKLLFGRLPCWLKWNLPRKHPDRKPEQIPAKVELVNRIFKLCLQGKGANTIANTLNEAKEPVLSTNTRAACWTAEFVSALLRDKHVLGYHCGHKALPAVVPEDVYYDVQGKMNDRKRSSATVRAANGNLFPAGLLRCSKCGGTMTRQHTGVGPYRYTYLICSDHLRGLKRCCASGMRYVDIEAFTLDLLISSGTVRQALVKQPDQPNALGALKGRLAAVTDEANGLMKALEGDPNPARRVMDRIKALEADETRLMQKIETETARVRAQRPALLSYDQARALAARIGEPGVREQLRSVLPEVIERVVVDVSVRTITIHLMSGQALLIAVERSGGWRLAEIGESVTCTQTKATVTSEHPH